MGIIYPDNSDRAERVKQLADNIASLQEQVKEDVEDARKQDERAFKILNKISKRAGHSSLDDYVKEALKKLSDGDRKKFEKMKGELQGKDDGIDLAIKIIGGVVALSLGARVGVEIVSKLINSSMFRVSFQTIGRGLTMAVEGAEREGTALARAGARSLSAALEGEEVAEEASQALSFVEVATNVLFVVAIVLDSILLIYEAYEGSKQKTELQKGTLELCARRLSVKKIQRYVRATLNFSSDAKSIVDRADDLQEEVDEGDITQEKAEKKIQEKINKVAPELLNEINSITDKIIWKMLDDQDTHSKIAWTKEDPSLKKIQDFIKDNPDS